MSQCFKCIATFNLIEASEFFTSKDTSSCPSLSVSLIGRDFQILLYTYLYGNLNNIRNRLTMVCNVMVMLLNAKISLYQYKQVT